MELILLSNLHLTGVHSISNSAVLQMLELDIHGSSLQHLSFDAAGVKSSDNIFYKMSTYCPNLRTINVQLAHSLTDETLNALASLGTLHDLTLRDNEQFTDMGILKLLDIFSFSTSSHMQNLHFTLCSWFGWYVQSPEWKWRNKSVSCLTFTHINFDLKLHSQHDVCYN